MEFVCGNNSTVSPTTYVQEAFPKKYNPPPMLGDYFDPYNVYERLIICTIKFKPEAGIRREYKAPKTKSQEPNKVQILNFKSEENPNGKLKTINHKLKNPKPNATINYKLKKSYPNR